MGDKKPFVYAWIRNPDPENLNFDVFPTLKKAVYAISETYSPEDVLFEVYYIDGTKEDVPENLYSKLTKVTEDEANRVKAELSKMTSKDCADVLEEKINKIMESGLRVWLSLEEIPEHYNG